MLADGTGYVGEIGVLAVDEDADLVQCHLCGRWLRSIGGSHLRIRHGWTGEQYREAFGLARQHSLDCPGRTAQRSALQTERMVSDPAIRDAIRRAIDRAHSGELARAARAADADPARRTYQRAERQLARQRYAPLGAAVHARRAAAARQRVTRGLGFADERAYLAARAERDGRSISAIAAELGVSRETVSDLLGVHGLSRGDLAKERQAVARAGFARFADYLTARAAAGVTVAAVARELGHSAAWVRVRARRDGLEALTRPPPYALTRARRLAADSGFPQLQDYLRHRYEVDGLTARQLQHELGLGPQRVARMLDTSGAARRHRPDVDEQRALSAVGYDSLASYAEDRHARGFTILAMAAELDRSDIWLARHLRAANLGHLIGTPGRPKADPDILARALGYDSLASYAHQRVAAGATVQDMAAELGHSDTWLARHLRSAGLGGLIGRPGNRYGRRGRPDRATPAPKRSP